jgi:ferredoxin-NADP reductase
MTLVVSLLNHSPLISMLQYIQQAQVRSSQTKIVLHYLIRLRRDALFMDTLSKLKHHLGSYFDGHLWITRKETAINDLSLPPGTHLQIHGHTASSQSEIGQPWNWWDSFSDRVLEHFDTKEKRTKSLVYICGPQGLTDRLLDMYKEQGVNTIDGHVQVEKWW